MVFDFCFVLQDMPATTPRAFRAILSLLKQGYSVMLIYNQRISTAEKFNKQLISELQSFSAFSFIEIRWKKNQLKTLLFKVLHKIFTKAYSIFSFQNVFMLSLVADYTIFWQLLLSRKIKSKVYVGHRPATLPVIHYLSKKYKGKTWFDIEDFHNCESSDERINTQMTKFLSNFPCQFYTNASALIGNAYQNANQLTQNSIEILNAPIFEIPQIDVNQSDKPSFVWFSQYISFQRGLELFIDALKISPISCVVHLIGNLRPEFKTYLIDSQLENVEFKFYDFIPETEILNIVASTDFGLALERNDVEYNRRIAITNKIITYSVGGNYIIATKTEGQTHFLSRIAENGILISQNASELSTFLTAIPQQLTEIRQNRAKRLLNSESICWTVEEKKLINFASKILT